MASPAKTLDELHAAYAAGLFRYLLGLVQCEADASDLLQELFIKLAARLPGRAAVVENERAWLWRMAHNLAVDWLRHHGTRRGAELRSAAEPARLFAPEADPDATEFTRQVEAALAALPVEQRSVVQMKLWEGLTLEEIAAAQGLSLNTAASRYRYALEKLRGVLRPLYEEIQP